MCTLAPKLAAHVQILVGGVAQRAVDAPEAREVGQGEIVEHPGASLASMSGDADDNKRFSLVLSAVATKSKSSHPQKRTRYS